MTADNSKPSLIRYDIYDQDYRSPQRQEWYSSVATAYRWARPRYPDTMLEHVLSQAHLSAQSSVLEVGCGPGIATTALAAKGLRMTAIDPSQGACAVARESCQDYPQVSIIQSTFEDFELTTSPDIKRYDAVLAATSFHWLSPNIACQKTAEALRTEGALILLWATPPQPSLEIQQWLHPVYENHHLIELGQEQCRSQKYYQDNFEKFAEIVNQSGFFKPSQVECETHHSTYTIEKYIALLSTLSGYIALDDRQRQTLLHDLNQALSSKLSRSSFNTTHWFAAQVAIKH